MKQSRRRLTLSSPDIGAAGSFGRDILILVPHPDDEVVGFCAAIGRARAAGARVRALYLTHGCVDRDSVWPWERRRYAEIVGRRRAEAEAVAAALGVEPAGWSSRPARHLWRELDAAEAEVRAVLAASPADQIWVPAFEGGNPDHDGANAIARRLADEGLEVLEFAEYTFAGGRPRTHAFPGPTGVETELMLSEAERAFKRRMVDLYPSERRNIGYVSVTRECFRPLAAYDYARPPHEGQLWFAMFRWVPFRHPQVDFTPPDHVYAALGRYLGEPAGAALGSR